MAFCCNCGQEIKNGLNYCPYCGHRSSSVDDSNESKTIFEGEVHVCPRCGGVLNSFVSKCPTCGYELRGSKSSDAINEFVIQLNSVSSDYHRVNLIRSFPVPNTKEDIFEFMILASSNIDDQPNKNIYDAWIVKIEQCYDKAKILFGNDDDFKKIKSIYDRTMKEIKNINRKGPIKNVAKKIIPILVIVLVYILFMSWLLNRIHKEGDKEKSVSQEDIMIDKEFSSDLTTEDEDNSFKTLNVKNFSLKIPNYWNEEGSKNEYLQYYAEKGDSVVMLGIGYPKETDDDYDVSFEGLYADNENMIDSIGSIFTDGDVVSYEEFESDFGVKGILYRFTFTQDISKGKKTEGCGYWFCFPSEEDRRWFYISIAYSNNIPASNYVEDYMTTIESVKKKQ